MNIHILQHVSFEGPGYIEKWALNNNFNITRTHLYKDIEFPDQKDFNVLVVMGGPMSVHDKISWMEEEKNFISETIKSGKKIIGICLGAQLIADVLGAEVDKNRYKEIGWFDIRITASGKYNKVLNGLPESFSAFHWHGETFKNPSGSISLFKSDACENQGYILEDRILGLQFHLEILEDGVKNLINNCRNELVEDQYIQSEFRIMEKTEKNINTANEYMHLILNNFFIL